MTDSARWAILGAGGIATDFADALPHAQLGHLHAVGARDAARARVFADRYDAPVAGTYDELFARGDIDAVYIATVHPTHAQLAHAAIDAGIAVLCEKPMTVTADDTAALIAHAAQARVPLIEAFKQRFGPFAERLHALVSSGELGGLVEIDSACGFDAGIRSGRLFDPATAGGAILDVGCYPVSFAVGVAASAGRDPSRFRLVEATGVIGDTGVDEQTDAVFDLDGLVARASTSIVSDLSRSARVVGEGGWLEVDNVWGSRSVSTDSATVHRGADAQRIEVPTVQPMAAEADATIAALRAGRLEAPEMPWVQSQAIARLLDQWRAAIS